MRKKIAHPPVGLLKIDLLNFAGFRNYGTAATVGLFVDCIVLPNGITFITDLITDVDMTNTDMSRIIL